MGDRFQVEKVASGCRKLRNFIIHPHGPAFRRPGMEYLGAAATSVNRSNLRSFQFSASTVFVLELSTAGLRVWQEGARVTLLAPVSLPYAAEELPDVQMCQVNDVVYLAHPNHHPRKLTRYADNDWRLELVSWKFPPMLDENPGSVNLVNYEEVASYDLSPMLTIGPTTFTGLSTAANFAILGVSPEGLGPRRILIEREYSTSGWTIIFNQTYTSVISSGTVLTATLTSGSGVGTALSNYRIRLQGYGFMNGGIPTRVQIRNGSGVELGGVNWPPGTIAQQNIGAGSWKCRIDVTVPVSGLSPYRGNTLLLQNRSAGGGWNTVETFDVSSSGTFETHGWIFVAHDFRWFFNGFEQLTPSGAAASGIVTGTAKLFKDAVNSDSQTAIAISDVTVGSGRTVLSNRPIWETGHVGSYWQLTHRRENAFVELISTSAAVVASATLTLTGVALAAATVTIGSRVYTWRASVTTTTNEVAVGGSSIASCSNLASAINAGAGGGIAYGSATAPHADVTAVAVSNTVVITARKPGKGAHSIPVTETMTNGSWNDVFLSGGVDENTIISAAETEGLRISGKWDVLTYGSWEATLYLERQTAAGTWEFVRSWRAKKDRNIAAQGETDGEETLRLRISAGTASESSNAAAPRFMLEAIDGRVDGLVKITSVESPLSATCDVITPCLSSDPTYTWTEGAWSDARGFPRAVTLHENRLWFGGTNIGSMRLWASVTGDIENFRRSSLADAGLSFTPSSGELNPIQWLLSQGSDLIIGTLGDEWTLNGEGQPITPSNFMFRPQSRFGSASVAAIMASEVVVFVQRGGRKVRRITQRSNNEPWSTSDMTVLAEHVAQKGIIQMAYGSNPNAILWAVTADGKLLGMTLEVEQNVFGWHMHETDGIIESVAVVYGTEADEVWLAVKRGTVRSIERLDPQVFSRDFSDYQTMMFCDAAKRFDGAPATVFTGLTHLNGKQVVCLADGVQVAPGSISGGQMTLAAPASKVVVGLPFTSELQPSRQEVQTQKGTAQGMLWRVSRVSAYVHESQGGQVAEHPGSRFENLPYPDATLYSGPLETVVESTARRSADVVVKTAAPLPFNLGSLTLKLDLYGD